MQARLLVKSNFVGKNTNLLITARAARDGKNKTIGKTRTHLKRGGTPLVVHSKMYVWEVRRENFRMRFLA